MTKTLRSYLYAVWLLWTLMVTFLCVVNVYVLFFGDQGYMFGEVAVTRPLSDSELACSEKEVEQLFEKYGVNSVRLSLSQRAPSEVKPGKHYVEMALWFPLSDVERLEELTTAHFRWHVKGKVLRAVHASADAP